MSQEPPEPVQYRFTHEAMATHFEIVFADCERERAAQAAAAAFADIDLLETELSRFRPDSDVGRVAALQAGESAVVGLALFDCLSLAQEVSRETDGAFDVTIGPLRELWKASSSEDREPPSDEAIAAAMSRVGCHQLQFDHERKRVTPLIDGLQIDLGGIGKGYALDQAAAVLRDREIPSALLNAGDSTVLAVGDADHADGWLVGAGRDDTPPIRLHDRALSGSGFAVKGTHIINPRTGRPAPIQKGKERMWAVAPTAALADALSTAFIVMDRPEIDALIARYAGEIEAISL